MPRPVGDRADYLRMRQGVLVPVKRRREVQAAVLEILEYSGLSPEELSVCIEPKQESKDHGQVPPRAEAA